MSDWAAGDLDYHRFTLSDGVSLAYVDTGPVEQGEQTVVMIPGWSQTAAQFKFQIPELSSRYRVIALDMRGHGESGKPAFGYRVSRLAADLHEFLTGLRLRGATLLAHSVGACVVWSYLESHGQQDVSRLIFVDEGACVVARPDWTRAEQRLWGCGMSDLAECADFYRRILAAKTEQDGAELIRRLFSAGTAGTSEENLLWAARENLKMPRQAAADLMWDASLADWRDTFARIRLPTLIIGAEASLFDVSSQRWIAGQIDGAKLEIFPADDGGSHFMFLENPTRFNRCVLSYMKASSAT